MTWTTTDPTTDPIYLSQLECNERLKNNTIPPPANEQGKEPILLTILETSVKHS